MLIQFFTLFSALNFAILGLVLLLKKSPIRKPNTILGVIFILMVLTSVNNLIAHYWYHNPSSEIRYYYLLWDHMCLLALGPGIYLYLREILGNTVSFRTVNTWKHFLPLLPALSFVLHLLLLPTEYRVQLVFENMKQNIWQIKLFNAFFYIQMTAYLVYSYWLVVKQLQISETVIVNQVQINIRWLKTYFIIDLAIMLLSAPVAFIINNDYSNSLISLAAMNIQFIYIYYNSYKQTGVFLEVKLEQPKFSESALKIDEKTVELYLEKLNLTMQNKKLYLEENCSIHQVAEAANIPYHHLSKIINSNLNKNFFTFINEYRIEEAKKMLSDSLYNQFTIEAIAFECGFGSKTSFNSAFKKCTGLTPQQFRKSIQDAPYPSSN